MQRADIAGAALLGTIATLDRAVLEEWIEAAIARLDALDGDPDLEDDDPAGDPLDAGEVDGIDELGDTFSDPAYYREQRARIRGERCFPIERRWREHGRVRVEIAGYELMQEPRVPSRRQLLRRRRGMPRSPRA